MSWRAMEQVNAELNDLFHWRPIRVLRARIQIVAGTKYVLDVLVAQSDCAKNARNYSYRRAIIVQTGNYRGIFKTFRIEILGVSYARSN